MVPIEVLAISWVHLVTTSVLDCTAQSLGLVSDLNVNKPLMAGNH
jgi:hypothetical protein